MLQACRLLFTACLFELQIFPTIGPRVKVTDWPVNFTSLSGTVIDRPAKVTDCTVALPGLSVSHHVQPGSPYLGQAGYLLQTGLFD